MLAGPTTCARSAPGRRGGRYAVDQPARTSGDASLTARIAGRMEVASRVRFRFVRRDGDVAASGSNTRTITDCERVRMHDPLQLGRLAIVHDRPPQGLSFEAGASCRLQCTLRRTLPIP